MEVRGFLEVQPRVLPDAVVVEAARVAGAPAALYVVDIQGEACRRLAGDPALPAILPLDGAIGSELGPAALDELRRHVAIAVPGAHVAPLALHGRTRAVLLAAGGDADRLARLASEAAPAMAIAGQFTDVLERARRAHGATPAAEAQQDLLAPRLARVTGGELAASVLPAYGVGGDWFDHADNPEATWLAVADAMGKGIPATAVAVIGLAALRAGRRGGDDLAACCRRMDRAVGDLHGDGFLTAVLATWEASTGTLRWISCGHPPPIVIGADGAVEELGGTHAPPLGVWPDVVTLTPSARDLRSGDRVLLYSDGITELRTDRGLLGHERLIELLRDVGPATAAETVAAVEAHVVRQGRGGFADDATQLVLAVA